MKGVSCHACVCLSAALLSLAPAFPVEAAGVPTIGDAIELLSGLKEHPYEKDSPTALYARQSEDGAVPARNACEGIYTSEGDRKRLRNIFDAADFGARGDGSSHPLGEGGRSIAEGPYARLNAEMPVGGGLRSEDEMDWVGIQSAIEAAGAVGGGVVILRDTAHDYLVNRGIWLRSNVSLVWLTDPERRYHSRIRLTKPTKVVGSVIGPYNPYRRHPGISRSFEKTDATARIEENRAYRSEGFVCRVALIDPRVTAITGENAVSFGMGSYGIHIIGGDLRGARFGTKVDVASGFNPEGGKAIQLESGVQQVEIRDTVVAQSTIGISSSAGYYLKVRREDPGRWERFQNASDRITIRDIRIEDTEMPLFIAGVRYTGAPQEATRIAPQSVDVKGFSIVRSGRLATTPNTPYGDEAVSLQAGIFNLFAASNVRICGTCGRQTGEIVGSEEIGSIIRGFGTDVRVSGLRIDAPFRSLIDTRTAFGRTASKVRLERFSMIGVDVRGRFEQVLRAAPPAASGNSSVSLSGVFIEVEGRGTAAAQRLDPEARNLPKRQLSPENLSIVLRP